MSIMNAILSIAFFVLAGLSYLDVVDLNEYYIFGLTVGALLISMSSCFEFEDKNEKNYFIKIGFITAGWISIIAIGVIKVPILDDVIAAFNADTLLFLSLGYTLVSIVVNDNNSKNNQLKLENEIRKEYEKYIEELLKKINSRE